MDGWICLHRELLDKPIWRLSTPEQKTILITLLLMANHEPTEWEWKGKKYTCNAGQMVTSLEKIAASCGKGVSIQNVRTSLLRFEKLEFLTNESTMLNRLITISNYDKYQTIIKRDNKATNKDLTESQQSANKDLTTNNNDNNDNNNNISVKNAFDDFWNLYDKKVGKDACEKKWAKLSVADRKKIFTTLPAYIASHPDKKYRKNPETYLNQRAWNDEIIADIPAQKTTTNNNNQSYKDSDIWQQR